MQTARGDSTESNLQSWYLETTKAELEKVQDLPFCFSRSCPPSPSWSFISSNSGPPSPTRTDGLSQLTALLQKGERKGIFKDKMPATIQQVVMSLCLKQFNKVLKWLKGNCYLYLTHFIKIQVKLKNRVERCFLVGQPVAWLMCWPTVNQKLSGRQLNLSVEAMLITRNAWEILFMYKSLFSAGSHRESSIYAEQGCL